MIKKIHKQHPAFFYLRNLLLMAMGMLVFNKVNATSWYVNDASSTGDIFTTAIGDDANPGTTGSPFATIQFAINSASSGDTIYVDAGTYVSADITISISVTLRGAKFGIPAGPAAVPANRGTGETIVQASIYYGQSLDNIAVDGFTVDVGTLSRGIQARGLNSIIINNILTGTVNPLVQQAGISTRGNGPARTHSYLIANNNVRGFRYGIYMDGLIENASDINYNYVTGCLTAGIVLTASNGHHLKANVSENNGQGLLCSKGNNLIEDNTFTGNAFIGIRLAASTFTFGNNIIHNFITNNGVGISLTEDDPAAVSNQANFNSFTGNTLAIANANTGNFNASCNWYGTSVAALIAPQIIGNVTFNPFLTDGTDTDPIDGFQPITTCVVVPVILTSFTASVKNYDVLLNWQTASEVNSNHFSIERSLDGQHFSSIGSVLAKGFSDVKVNYNFTDKKPVNFDKPTYYRIAMVDNDGTFKYTKIISVVLKTNGSFVQQVYPNPAQAGTVLHTDFISGISQKINISFVNSSGQSLHNYEFQASKGTNEFNIQIPADASAGVNFLLIRSSDNVKRVPLFIH